MEGPNKWPEDTMSKELSENISWIDISTVVEEPDHIRGNGLMNMVVSQCIVMFNSEELGMVPLLVITL
jgi:hypothetical protein